MCERLKQAVLKTAVLERVPGVRIPLPPPYSLNGRNSCCLTLKIKGLRLSLGAPIQDLLGGMALLAQLAQAEGIVALGQPNFRFVARQIAMVVGGNR